MLRDSSATPTNVDGDSIQSCLAILSLTVPWSQYQLSYLMTAMSSRFLLSTANLRICLTFCSQGKIRPTSVLGGETTPSCFIEPVRTVHLCS